MLFRSLTYSMLDLMMASPKEPLSKEKRVYQLTKMFEGLDSLERGESASPVDWEWVSDAVLMMGTLRDMGLVEDSENLIEDAFDALGRAGSRRLQGKSLRLDGPGIKALRAVLEDYASVLDMLPARTMISAHRKAEKLASDILRKSK